MAEQLCPKGKAPFTILEAEQVTSKSGKEMLKLKLNVHSDDGNDYHVYDYVSPEFMAFKFRHFFYAIGAGQAYEAGTVDVDSLVGREGWCEVGHQKGKDGYKTKESISDYLTESDKSKPVPAPAKPDNTDDVPF